jgi:uncharacterized protein YgiB involved in biofilm formation
MKVTCTVSATYEVTLYGVELDVPDDVASQGDKAIEAWAKANKHHVDYAPIANQETCRIVSVAQVYDVEM